MHAYKHVRNEFNEWFERRKKARAFPNDDVELQAAICTYDFGTLALNHRRINEPWMREPMARTQEHLHQLEAVLGLW